MAVQPYAFHYGDEQKGVSGKALPSQVLLSTARWRPGGHRQHTAPPLSIWQPNWHRRERHAASSGRQTGKS